MTRVWPRVIWFFYFLIAVDTYFLLLMFFLLMRVSLTELICILYLHVDVLLTNWRFLYSYSLHYLWINCGHWDREVSVKLWWTWQTWMCHCVLGKCWEAWGTFWKQTDQSITVLITWRKEEWRKEVADAPPCEIWNDRCSTRPTLMLFRGQNGFGWVGCGRRGKLLRDGKCAYELLRVQRFHLEWNLKLVLWNFNAFLLGQGCM